MCGIFGYIGDKSAPVEVVKGLARLEYRGYDSAGIATVNASGTEQTFKSVGRVINLANKIHAQNLDGFSTAIGHTRWATHGGVTEKNCHPHASASGRFSVVHNGIIENYGELKKMLEGKGRVFASQTDTEVAVQLFEYLFDGDTLSTLKKTVKQMEGAYALVFLDTQTPNALFGAKLGSPLVIGQNATEWYISSDYRSLIGLCTEYITLEDGDIFRIQNGQLIIVNNGVEIVRDSEAISEENKMNELGDFPNYMLKEIYEQPDVMRNVFAGRIDFEKNEITNHTLAELAEKKFDRVQIVASGTSYHAGLV